MIMTTNEVLTRQNFLTKVLLKNDEAELSKDLKIKIMKLRIEYSKVRKQFDADLQEFVKELTTPRFNELQQKANKSEEEEKELKELTDKINEDYIAYVNKRGQDEVMVSNENFSEDEFNEIIEVNADNDVEINGTKLNAADFLEIFYTLFIEENGKD